MSRPKLNKTQSITLIIFGVVLLIDFTIRMFSSQDLNIFVIFMVIINLVWVFGIIIGVIALVKNGMPGWGIHNRKTAAIVLAASFLLSLLIFFAYAVWAYYDLFVL